MDSRYPDFHKSLQSGQCRLLHLLPGTRDDLLKVEIHPHCLQPGKYPYYEAVSYAWGDPVLKGVVTCGEHIVRTTASAAGVLHRLRRADETRLLWIDALCINQVDLAERTQQVSIMETIYRCASQVLIYLGEEGESSNEAMDCIAQRSGLPTFNEIYFVRILLERPWFHRVWVLQEVAVAEGALVICGSKCVPWACFLAWWARNAAHMRGLEPPATLSYDPAVKARSSLLHKLHESRRSYSTDPRDRLFALMGVLSSEDKAGIVVDYTLSIAATYRNVAEYIMSKHESLETLSGVIDNGRMDASWVPDWDAGPQIVSLGLSNKFSEPYDAGGKPACGIRFSSNRLTCLGLALDSIVKVSWGSDQCRNDDEVADTLDDWNRAIAEHKDTRRVDRALPKAIFHSRGIFFPVAPRSRHLWATILALPASTLQLSADDVIMEESRPLFTEALEFTYGRKFAITKSGFFGLVPPQTEPGDIIAVLLGAPVPHVLRKTAEGYRLVGECYVRGIMNGEALAHLREELTEMGHRCRPFPKSKSSSVLQTFIIN